MKQNIHQTRLDNIERARQAAAEKEQTGQHTDVEPQSAFEVEAEHDNAQSANNATEKRVNDKESNDAAAWKGRLSQTQEQLKLEREARAAAALEAARFREEAEKRRLEAERDAKELEEARLKLKAYQENERRNFLSEEEKGQLSEFFGTEATDLLTRVIAKVRPTEPQVDIEDVIAKRFQEESKKTLEREWSTAVQNRIPEAHILRADERFIEFALSKKDWYGNTALSVMDDIGSKRDVSRIGVIESLIKEFKMLEQQQDSSSEAATSPPRSVSNVPAKRNNGADKKVVKKSEFMDRVAYYKARGQTDALREYLSKHECSGDIN